MESSWVGVTVRCGMLCHVTKLTSIVCLLAGTMLIGGCAAVVVGATAAMSNEKSRTKVVGFVEELSESIERSIRKTNSAGAAEQQTGYKSGDGVVLRLYSSSIEPRVVDPGGEVVVKIEYALVGTPDDGVNVKERRLLRFNGKQLASLNNDVERRDNGTWESALSFRVPNVAQEGSYEVFQELETSGRSVTSSVVFEVRG